jgi:type I site-specific restriction endonuclease
MKIQDIQNALQQHGITATEQQIRDVGIPPEEITSETIGILVDALKPSTNSTAIAPTTPSAAITPKRKGGMTKAELQRQLEATQAQLERVQAPVQQVHAHVSNQVKDLVLHSIKSYVADGEDAIDQGSTAIAQYRASAPLRFWQAVDKKQGEIGIFDPTESMHEQQKAKTAEFVESINQIFEESDRALGIQGFTVEGQL